MYQDGKRCKKHANYDLINYGRTHELADERKVIETDTLSTTKKNRILNPRLFSTIKKIDVCWYIDCAQSAQYKYNCSVPYEPSAKYKCTKPGSEDPVGPVIFGLPDPVLFYRIRD